MPDVKRTPHRIVRLTVGGFPHRDQLFRKTPSFHSVFNELHILKFNRDAIEIRRVLFDFCFECALRFSPGNDIYISFLTFSEPSEVFHLRIRFQAREADPNGSISHATCSGSLSLEPASDSRLTSEEKRLWIHTFAAKFERSKVFVPWALWNFRFCFHPQSESI